MTGDRGHVLHVLECIARIERYTAAGQESFFAETLIQDGVLRNLQTLAESTQRLTEEVRNCHPEVPWRSIAGFRNVVVHNYLGIDLDDIWSTVVNDLPPLQQAMQVIMLEIEGEA